MRGWGEGGGWWGGGGGMHSYSHFCIKNISVFGYTLAATFNVFVINKLVKLMTLSITGPWKLNTLKPPQKVASQQHPHPYNNPFSSQNAVLLLYLISLQKPPPYYSQFYDFPEVVVVERLYCNTQDLLRRNLVSASMAQLDVHPTGDLEIKG